MPVSLQIENKSPTHPDAIFTYATISIIVANVAGIITDINPFALNEFGYYKNELVGKKIEELVPSRFRIKHSQHHINYAEKPVTRNMCSGQDLCAIRKDGSEFPVEISLSNYQFNGEKFVIAYINNISIRKQSEANIIKVRDELEATVEKRTHDLNNTLHKLQISNDTLDEVNSFQKAILDNAGAMIFATDKNAMIKLFNPEAAAKTGYHESEIIYKKTALIFHDKNEIKARRAELMNEFGISIKDDFAVMIEKARRDIHEEQQYSYIRKDGSTFPVSLIITAIKDGNEEIAGFMGIVIDISERKKAEINLIRSLEKEKELNELKSRFVSMASHEFRTPLSTVLSSAYLIEKYSRQDEQPKREKHLQRIVSSVNMLTEILNDFLNIGKIEEGKIQVRPVKFNVCELINTLIAEMKSNLKNHQEINYCHEGEQDTLMDATLLKHIMMNLISNASKFSPENTVININSNFLDSKLVIIVEDRGIGISTEDQKHLMERFFRGANAGNIEGTGLGLHIVSKYVELMNGMVDFFSILEKGTQFRITFNP